MGRHRGEHKNRERGVFWKIGRSKKREKAQLTAPNLYATLGQGKPET